ncbi:MAG: hypothetical protein PVH19_06135 [Planctomycetia bacterium]|jgi:hypothetical protein
MNDKYEQISMLVDGELPTEAANELLREIMADETLRKELEEQLRLRATLAPWRKQQPKNALLHATISQAAPTTSHFGPSPLRRYAEIVGAAVLAGLLVFAGFWVARNGHQPNQVAYNPPLKQSWIITPEKQKEVADIFAFHESVAGPLTWLADGESKIEVNEASETSAKQQAIAVLIRLKGDPNQPTRETKMLEHEYIVVCRAGSPATIDLPDGDTSLKLHLLAERDKNNHVQIQYAFAAMSPDHTPGTLSGERVLGLQSRSLGQLVMNHELYSVEAGAWQLGKTKP